MFANTLTITINSVAQILTRVNQDNYGSVYTKKTATDEYNLKFRNSKQGSDGVEPLDVHNMYFEHIVYATSTTTEKKYSVSSTLKMRRTSDPAYLAFVVPGFNTLLNSQAAGLIGGES
jgi:hypothetical protein